MLVIVNTALHEHQPITPAVVTLDTRSVFLLARASSRALYDGAGKVHWARRTQDKNGRVVAHCSTAVGTGYYPYTGKPTDITCTKCRERWWNNERLLGNGGADFIQRYS